jgi:hypothetical protein
MSLRRARELVVLMVREFQPYGATWAELMPARRRTHTAAGVD